ncbi:DUF3800 domain-containing protein [Cellulomonas sp. ES6]|uniref:DUF3800 domain-containing protein n=1 Tax=Cellulomonas sp. ES6 TaxID=3039384 RepID=UPI0024B6E9EA|nr:DUF3800 domain-containing protein [Cellulomonas sp. ES6]WHP16018.1 DUF3800 domain-containing protein [Cellulomonas sp. ES6]
MTHDRPDVRRDPFPSGLLLAYVDESYTAERFYLGAVLVDGEAAARIEAGFDAIVGDYCGRFGLSPAAEMHANPLFQGKGEWRDVPTRARINVYARAMQVLGSSGAQVVLRGMNVRRQRERYVNPHPPHEVVLGHLLERVDERAEVSGAHALVLADEVHNSDRHRTNFREFRVGGTPGYRSTTLHRLIDTIHFAPSEHSRLLQAADLVTFLHRRRCTHAEADPRAQRANDEIWGRVAPAIVHELCWEP